ncbi:helix-turn-helix transcriptional regulator [Stutzerimonas stutzeri]
MVTPKTSVAKRNPSPAGTPAAAVGNVLPLPSSTSTRTAPSFDPAATLIRMPDLLALTGLQRATVYKRLKDDPTFPRPVPLSTSTARGAPVAFVLAEVQAWVRARIEARDVA